MLLKIKSLNQRLKKANDFVNEIIGQRKHIVAKKNEFLLAIENCQTVIEDTGNAVCILEYIIELRNRNILKLFEHTISAGLKDIFDDSYEFRFKFGKRGNLLTCDYQLKNSQFCYWHDIRHSHGRSVKEIIAVILRIVLVKLDKNLRDIIILDEPLGGLEESREIPAAKFLAEIAEKFALQLIIVTQSARFAAYAHKKLEI